MRFLMIGLLLTLAARIEAQDLIAKSEAKSPDDERKSFSLPSGFEAQLVVSEPDIQKPMQLAFDTKGRMWTTTSHHYPWAAETGKGTDKLYVLSDFDEQGKAKSVKVFDDRLNIPIGVLPLEDGKSVVVGECGRILKLTDTDGDGKADKREVLYEGFGYRDTHGMTNSYTPMPDGWIYACHGFANDSKVKGKDGHEISMNSGHTFRFKADGSRLEIHTRGQVNPFGIAVDPWGNLYTADCHSKPITQLIRGAYYDSFNKPHDGLGYAPHVINHLHDSTGLCGLTYYHHNHFPKEWNGVMFLGNVVTSRINVDRIVWQGSTPQGTALPDFLVSSDPWFRPVDIRQGPDGALYVSDFYNRIIGHYEVDLKHPGRDKDRGRIWRIVWKGKPHEYRIESPKELAEMNPLRELAAAKELTDANRKTLLVALKSEPRIARVAVDVLCVHPHEDFAMPLLNMASTVDPKDTHLKHASMVALGKNARVTQAVFNALMDAAETDKTKQAAFFDIAMMAPTKDIYRKYSTSLLKLPLTLEQRVRFVEQSAAQDPVSASQVIRDWNRASSSRQTWTNDDFQLLVAACRNYPASDPRDEKSHCWCDDEVDEALEWQFGFGGFPSNDLVYRLFRELAPKLSHRNAVRFVQRAISGYTQWKPTVLQRQELLEGLSNFIDSKHQKEVKGFVIDTLSTDTELSPAFRSAMVLKLAGKLATADLIQISKLFKTSPYTANVNYALALSTDPFGADSLLSTIKAGEAPARLLQEPRIVEQLRKTKVKDLDAKLRELTKDLPAPEKRIDELIRIRAAGFSSASTDLTKGKELFTKHCAICHQISSIGAKVGPQLDGIGIRGLDRLLEDTLDPNRNVDHAFRQTRFDMKDGSLITGLLQREEGDLYIVADNTGKEVRLLKADVDRKSTSHLSAMPANLESVMSEGEYYHLLKYLLDQKAKK